MSEPRWHLLISSTDGAGRDRFGERTSAWRALNDNVVGLHDKLRGRRIAYDLAACALRKAAAA